MARRRQAPALAAQRGAHDHEPDRHALPERRSGLRARASPPPNDSAPRATPPSAPSPGAARTRAAYQVDPSQRLVMVLMLQTIPNRAEIGRSSRRSSTRRSSRRDAAVNRLAPSLLLVVAACGGARRAGHVVARCRQACRRPAGHGRRVAAAGRRGGSGDPPRGRQRRSTPPSRRRSRSPWWTSRRRDSAGVARSPGTTRARIARNTSRSTHARAPIRRGASRTACDAPRGSGGGGTRHGGGAPRERTAGSDASRAPR